MKWKHYFDDFGEETGLYNLHLIGARPEFAGLSTHFQGFF